MKYSMLNIMRRLLLLGVMVAPTVFSKPALHVLFHMGLGANGQFFVGGTFENKGDKDIYQGYVVIIPLTKECYPKQPLLSTFGVIKAGQKHEFKIPVQGRLNGYKLDTVHAVDSFANPIAVIDETADILASKKESYNARCKEIRGEDNGTSLEP
ncbi:hypothetical protein AB2J22_21310 [Aeromonas sp. A5]|uniref:hypothetical protein n=1 Tax=unclassified Aeromonas TaxID=257493 RepID=UPI00376FF261